MNDTVNIWVCGKDFVKAFFVCNVDFVEFWSLSAQKLDAIEGNFGRVIQTVNYHDFVAMLEKREGGEGPDISGASVCSIISIVLKLQPGLWHLGQWHGGVVEQPHYQKP